MVSNPLDYRRELLAHYARTWGAVIGEHRWEVGPHADLGRDFSVACLAPSDDTLAFATVGMSRIDEADAIELHVLAPRKEPALAAIVELLTVVAHYHRTAQRIGLHHTVYFGRPWLPGATCAL